MLLICSKVNKLSSKQLLGSLCVKNKYQKKQLMAILIIQLKKKLQICNQWNQDLPNYTAACFKRWFDNNSTWISIYTYPWVQMAKCDNKGRFRYLMISWMPRTSPIFNVTFNLSFFCRGNKLHTENLLVLSKLPSVSGQICL